MVTEVEQGDTITVEVAYGLPDRQFLEALDVPAGTTALEAIDASSLREAFPEVGIDSDGIGVFSRKVPLDHVLSNGDRVEIYRPLLIDPKEARRARAEAAM